MPSQLWQKCTSAALLPGASSLASCQNEQPILEAFNISSSTITFYMPEQYWVAFPTCRERIQTAPVPPLSAILAIWANSTSPLLNHCRPSPSYLGSGLLFHLAHDFIALVASPYSW